MNQPIVYVTKACNLCGGVRVILEHIYHLSQRGYDVKLFYLYDSPDWFHSKIESKKFSSLAELYSSLRNINNSIKIATWCETAYWVVETLNSQDRGYYLVQDIEDSYFVKPEQKEYALSTYKLGLKPLATSKYVQRELKARFNLDSIYISLGIDLDFFKPSDLPKDPFRVLTQCRVFTAGPNLKDWPTAKKSVELAFEQDKRVSLVTYSIEDKQQVTPGLPHIHISKPDDKWVRELYNTSGLFLLSSRHEGLGLTGIEAMAMRLPVVCTLAQGNEEYCFHKDTCLATQPGDYLQLSKHILEIFNDRDTAKGLVERAYSYIQIYNWQRSIDILEQEFTGSASLLHQNVSMSQEVSIEYPDVIDDWHFNEYIEATIIIPTVNDYEKTRACIDSLAKTIDLDENRIIIVDDGTRDKEILANLSELEATHDVLYNNQNLGFSASVNQGMMQSFSKYIILCNNDVQVQVSTISNMIKCAESDPKIGIVGAKLLYSSGNVQHGGMYKLKDQLQFLHFRTRFTNLDDEYMSDTYPVWAVTGALFLIKREAVKQLGGLSTGYATAWEDVDYCLHAWTNKWKVFYTGPAVAFHTEGATRGATQEQKATKPLIWSERERAGEEYFKKKWDYLKNVNDLSYFG